MDLGLLGALTLGAFLILVLVARAPVIAALVLVPIVAAVVGGFTGALPKLVGDGLVTVTPVAVMIMFAVLYFGLMLDVGVFEPLVRGLSRLVRDDPVRLCLVSAALPTLVAFDGDGATTFLISVTALLPVHRRLGLDPRVLPAIVALAAGVMNILPWGGPTARAMAALDGGIGDLFIPIVPAMLGGLAWTFAAAAWLGARERRRLAGVSAAALVGEPANEAAETPRRPPHFWINLTLTLLLVVLLFQDFYRARIGMPPIPAALLFMAAFAIALPLNRRTWAEQQAQLAAHAPSVVLVTSMIFAAGVFSGVLRGSGMIPALAAHLAGALPPGAGPWMPELVAVSGMPLSFVFTPDAFYFGVLPVFADTARSLGEDPFAVGRAALLGQMTTGFPLSPLTASTFILIGLSGVTLRAHQTFTFAWAFGSTVVMTLVATAVGAL